MADLLRDASSHVLLICSHVIAILLAMAVTPFLLRLRTRLRFRGAFMLDADKPVLIVIADRPIAQEESSATQGRYFSAEDVFATREVEAALVDSGYDRKSIEVRLASQFGKDDPRDREKNIVLICSPKSNAVCRMFMEELDRTGASAWSFVGDPLSKRWHIQGKNAPFKSESYADEESLLMQGRSSWEGPVWDKAILGRFANPWNGTAKVYVIAGIRGLGTWGAARFLHRHLDRIKSAANGRDVVWLLRVMRRNYSLGPVQIVLQDDYPGVEPGS